MSRSRQAFRLAAHLSDLTGVGVELVYDTGAVWHLSWADGPLREEMRTHLDGALADYRFAEMRDRTITTHRGTSTRAWAARAIASRREGTLATAVSEGAAWRRAHLPQKSPFGGAQLTPEDHALLSHINELIDVTPYPDRASAPEDEPLIEDLLAAGTRKLPYGGRTISEYDMARVLLNADRAPATGRAPELQAAPDPEPVPPRTSLTEEAVARTEAANAPFLQGLPGPREITTTGELAAVLARLPQDTPVFLGEGVVSHPGPIEDPVHSVVAHITACAEPSQPDDPDSVHQMRPALGLTTIRIADGQDPGAEFEREGTEPHEPLTRAEDRLTSHGNLADGIRDAAHVIDTVALLLQEGAEFIPPEHDAHVTITVETSRLRHAADRLRKTAAEAQKASE